MARMFVLPIVFLVIGVVLSFAFAVGLGRALTARPCPLCGRGRMRWVASHRADDATGAAIDVVDAGTCGSCRGTVVQSHRYGWRGVHGTGEALAALRVAHARLSWSRGGRLWRLLDRCRPRVARLCAPPRRVTVARSLGMVAAVACLVLGVAMADKAERIQAIHEQLRAGRQMQAALVSLEPPPPPLPRVSGATPMDRSWESDDQLADDSWYEEDLDQTDDSIAIERPSIRHIDAIGLSLTLGDRWTLRSTSDNYQGRAALFDSSDLRRPGMIAVGILRTPPGADVTSTERLTAALRGGMSGPEMAGPRTSRSSDCRMALRGVECLSVPDDPQADAVIGWAWEADGSAVVMVATMPNRNDIDERIAEAYEIAKSVEFGR